MKVIKGFIHGSRITYPARSLRPVLNGIVAINPFMYAIPRRKIHVEKWNRWRVP